MDMLEEISPVKVKLIGSGENGIEMVKSMYACHVEKLKNIPYKLFNKPTKPDYLDIKLMPDYRNIQAAKIKKELADYLNIVNSVNDPNSKERIVHDASRPSVFKKAMIKLRSAQDAEEAFEAEPSVEPVKPQNGLKIRSGRGDDLRDRKVNEARMELESGLKEFMPDTDILFIITDLESAYGIDNAFMIGKFARKLDVLTVVLVLLPTRLATLENVEDANRSLQGLRLLADIVVVIPQLGELIQSYLVLIISELLELMTTSGLVNLDVADIRTVVGDGNVAMLGLGSGRKDDADKIASAINEAVTSPLLAIDLNGVTRTLVNITGDQSMTVSESQEVARAILNRIEPNARLIWGAAINQKLNGAVKLMVMVGVKPKNILLHLYASS